MAKGTDTGGVWKLSGPLTFNTVNALFRDSEKRMGAQDGPITVDLEQVGKVDSAGLAMLLEWQSMSRKAGFELHIQNAPRDLLRLAALCEASEPLGLLPVPDLAWEA